MLINHGQNWDFPKFFTKIHIFENFYQNRHFSKILTKIRILRKFWTKSRFSKIFDHNWDYLIILTNFEIFKIFLPKSKLFPIIGIFIYFGPKSNFFENDGRYKDLIFLLPKSRFSEKFTQNLVFPKNLDQNRDFRKLWTKSRFSKIFTKIKF